MNPFPVNASLLKNSIFHKVGEVTAGVPHRTFYKVLIFGVIDAAFFFHKLDCPSLSLVESEFYAVASEDRLNIFESDS